MKRALKEPWTMHHRHLDHVFEVSKKEKRDRQPTRNANYLSFLLARRFPISFWASFFLSTIQLPSYVRFSRSKFKTFGCEQSARSDSVPKVNLELVVWSVLSAHAGKWFKIIYHKVWKLNKLMKRKKRVESAVGEISFEVQRNNLSDNWWNILEIR